MVEIHPIRIPGRWVDGRALDVHTVSSTYLGDDELGHARFDTVRSGVGELLYRLKYHAEPAAIADLAETAAIFVRSWRPDLELVVAVPPSRARQIQPVLMVGAALAAQLGIPFCSDCVRRTRDVPQLKDVFDYDERWKLLEGLHDVDAAAAEGKKVLLFDDLFRSGATMNSITAALYDRGHAAEVCALALTRTRSRR